MEFKFPAPHGSLDEPAWTGTEFLLGSEKIRVLKYTQCDEGWDASLTEFHEDAAEEGNHYIDRASRFRACHELKKTIKNKNAVILEIGSSSGYLLEEIKKILPETFLIGSDCILEPLENIAKKIPDLPLIEFDLINCPLPDNSIDVVIALNVLEHIKDDDHALKQIYRIVKPGGFVIIEVPANPGLYDFYDEQLRHYRRYSLHNLCTMAQKENFIIMKASHLGFFIYPAFRHIKIRNKHKKLITAPQKQITMKNLIQFGGPVINKFFFFLLIIELFIGNFIPYPVGIRCLLLLKKKIE